jgi:hypothetical protein
MNRPGGIGVVIAAALALSAPAADAARFRGSRTLTNPSSKRAMPPSRARPIARRIVHRAFRVRARSEIYACSRHSFAESGCDVQFTTRAGTVACGNLVVSATAAAVTVRYDIFTGGCGDF